MAEAAASGGLAATVRRLTWQVEGMAFWLVIAPLLALLPARLAYRAACWRGGLTRWYMPQKRDEVLRNLRQVLGEELSQQQAERITRDHFRIRSCEIVDLMRLRGRGRSLTKLVDIRGREHLDAALAGGKGVILCSAHFGSYDCAFSVLGAEGFKVTSIGRWWWNYLLPDGASAERRMWRFVYARRLLRHRHRPNIEPWPGRFQVAAQAAAALRDNEVVTICSDAPPLDAELPRTVVAPLLGQQVTLLPGVVTLARLTRAPVLMLFAHRCADFRHQVLEVSPPVPMDGEPATAFGRCLAVMDAAIRANPADWDFWYESGDLARLGLIPAAPKPAGDSAGGIGELQRQALFFCNCPQATFQLKGDSPEWIRISHRSSRPIFSCSTPPASMTSAIVMTCCSRT